MTEWTIDREAGELVGPCGCRVPNTFDGMLAARTHTCPPAAEAPERVAHALCPYCHPHDPTDPDAQDPAPGTPVTRWCGRVVPIAEPAGPDAALCPDCARPGSACATCGAVSTLLGVRPPKDQETRP